MLVEFLYFWTETRTGRRKPSTYRRRRSDLEAEGLEPVEGSSEWRARCYAAPDLRRRHRPER